MTEVQPEVDAADRATPPPDRVAAVVYAVGGFAAGAAVANTMTASSLGLLQLFGPGFDSPTVLAAPALVVLALLLCLFAGRFGLLAGGIALVIAGGLALREGPQFGIDTVAYVGIAGAAAAGGGLALVRLGDRAGRVAAAGGVIAGLLAGTYLVVYTVDLRMTARGAAVWLVSAVVPGAACVAAGAIVALRRRVVAPPWRPADLRIAILMVVVAAGVALARHATIDGLSDGGVIGFGPAPLWSYGLPAVLVATGLMVTALAFARGGWAAARWPAVAFGGYVGLGLTLAQAVRGDRSAVGLALLGGVAAGFIVARRLGRWVPWDGFALLALTVVVFVTGLDQGAVLDQAVPTLATMLPVAFLSAFAMGAGAGGQLTGGSANAPGLAIVLAVGYSAAIVARSLIPPPVSYLQSELRVEASTVLAVCAVVSCVLFGWVRSARAMPAADPRTPGS